MVFAFRRHQLSSACMKNPSSSGNAASLPSIRGGRRAIRLPSPWLVRAWRRRKALRRRRRHASESSLAPSVLRGTLSSSHNARPVQWLSYPPTIANGSVLSAGRARRFPLNQNDLLVVFLSSCIQLDTGILGNALLSAFCASRHAFLRTFLGLSCEPLF